MTAQERLNKVYRYLYGNEIVQSRDDCAKKIDVSGQNFSRALNGNEKYLTMGFLRKLLTTFPQINPNWLLNDEGEMLVKDDGGDFVFSKEHILWMQQQIEEKNKQLQDYKNTLEELCLKTINLLNNNQN